MVCHQKHPLKQRRLGWGIRRVDNHMTSKVPNYAADPLRAYLRYWDESSGLLYMSMQAIGALRGMPRLIKALEAFPSYEGQEATSKVHLTLEEATRHAEFAEKEVDEGFPLLHAHTLVGLWGALEVAIDDLLVGILANEPTLLQNDSFGKIRVPLADFQVLETDERMRLLIRELGRTPGAGRRQGVDQFEALLSHFALSGDVERQVKQDILEINHVRNVIVHRGSLADRRLTQCCPWMDLRIGDKVLVTPVGFRRYSQALESYVLEITYRVGYRYGIDTKALVEEREKQNASRESSTGSVP